jgi:multiple sugar transport system substrate-binding protein
LNQPWTVEQTMNDTSMQLRGMAWDHPRGIDPLRATAQWLEKQGVRVHWAARSLQGFEEASIAQLAAEYDLIAIDHPFMGDAFRQGALQPVDEILDSSFMLELQRNSVGASYESYRWRNKLWAVPIDAAAQVAAFRPDILTTQGGVAPQTWDEVFHLAAKLRAGLKIALPANPTHILLAFATICHTVAADGRVQDDLRPGWWRDDGIDPQTADEALNLLRRLLDIVHPMSWDADPIMIFEHMVRHDDIVYTPIAFGYSNYARASSFDRPLSFRGVPSMDGSVIGGMLGGVGLAASRRCVSTDAVATALHFIAGGAVQRGLYAQSGGQPAHRSAWTDAGVNSICPNFFEPTLASLDRSFVRPRISAYPAFQRDGGLLLHKLLRSSASNAEVIDALNGAWMQLQTQMVERS